MPPLGGLQFGHKGYGLAMMVEMLVGPLSHAGCTKGDKGGGNGVMVLAIDIAAFTSLDTYVDEVEGLAEWVCSAKPLPGFNKVYAPGEIEEETRQRRLQEGIDVAEKPAEIGKTATGWGWRCETQEGTCLAPTTRNPQQSPRDLEVDVPLRQSLGDLPARGDLS